MAGSSDIRTTVFYTGHVQGVGFRFTCERIARQFPVRGYVRNLPDGRVELVVEGQKPDVDRFLQRVQETMRDHIRSLDAQQQSATGQFDGFGIRY